MTDREEIEQLKDENLRLRSAAESSLLFAEEVLGHGHLGEGMDAQALIGILNEALTPAERR